MKLHKVCNYKATNYNILPAILYTPIMECGVFIAFRLSFKIFNRHIGIEVDL